MNASSSSLERPRVSVCIPTRNRATDLVHRLDEFRTQTLTDLEIVVIDDASTDDTPARVAAVAASDSRVRYVGLDPALGVPAVIMRCFTEAKSDLVAIAHDHDIYRPDAIERLARAIDEHPDATFGFCGVRAMDPMSGEILSDSADTTRPALREDVPWHFVRHGNSLVGASAVIVRKAATVGIELSSDLGLFADVELWCALARRGPAAYVDESLVDVVGWTRGEGLRKLNWATLRCLRAMRLELVPSVAERRSERATLTVRVFADDMCRRARWTAQMLRHAGQGGETAVALQGSPTVVRAAVALMSRRG